MSEFSYDYSVLFIAEPDFVRTSKDAAGCITRMQKFLSSRAADSNLRMVSVSGRYGVELTERIEVDDKNKTAFVKSLDDRLNQFNEIVIITNFDKEQFIDALGIRLNELSKSFTIYGYETRSHEKS